MVPGGASDVRARHRDASSIAEIELFNYSSKSGA
jgi:hypothetical protein